MAGSRPDFVFGRKSSFIFISQGSSLATSQKILCAFAYKSAMVVFGDRIEGAPIDALS